MALYDTSVPIYLDQNVFSCLQCKRGREVLLPVLETMRSVGGVFVYSMIHVDECRQSKRPEIFADILDNISAYFMEYSDRPDGGMKLSAQRAQELILAEPDLVEEAVRSMESLLKLMHFMRGWLNGAQAQDLLDEVVKDVNCFWIALETGIPKEILAELTLAKNKMLQSIQDLPLTKLQDKGRRWQDQYQGKLPKKYKQLESVAVDEVVDIVVSHLDAGEQREIGSNFPRGFWSEIGGRTDDKLAASAFMLFLIGVVKDRRVRKKDRERAEKHFVGQFRDCQHIELASRCPIFVTLDKGAARLAKGVYAYAGVATHVLHLEMRQT